MSGEKAVDFGTIIELLVIAFGGGAAWGTLRSRLKGIELEVAKIRQNDLPHIRQVLADLPCREHEDCAIANPKS